MLEGNQPFVLGQEGLSGPVFHQRWEGQLDQLVTQGPQYL